MKIKKITKIENSSKRYDIQTTTQNFFIDGMLVHNSMITPVIVDGKILMKSKKAFTSDVAQLAQAFVDARPNYLDFCKACVGMGFTPIFEYTSPKARIVLNYGVEDLVLLHIRNNVTGVYLADNVIKEVGSLRKIPTVFTYTFCNTGKQMDYFFDALETLTDFEGYVFQFSNGDMVKAKSKWYLDLHHNVTFLSERRVAEMVLDETVDDFKSYLADTDSHDSIATVERIEAIISHDLARLEIETYAIWQAHKDLIKKDFVMSIRDNPLFIPYFGLAVKLFEGREPDYKEHYRKNYLKAKFGLDQV